MSLTSNTLAREIESSLDYVQSQIIIAESFYKSGQAGNASNPLFKALNNVEKTVAMINTYSNKGGKLNGHLLQSTIKEYIYIVDELKNTWKDGALVNKFSGIVRNVIEPSNYFDHLL